MLELNAENESPSAILARRCLDLPDETLPFPEANLFADFLEVLDDLEPLETTLAEPLIRFLLLLPPDTTLAEPLMLFLDLPAILPTMLPCTEA